MSEKEPPTPDMALRHTTTCRLEVFNKCKKKDGEMSKCSSFEHELTEERPSKPIRLSHRVEGYRWVIGFE